VVSFLTADATPVTGSASEKGPGSWLLLIRIAIISAGVLLAFVAAGIPMDRLAVIIGALSVGIGFGLQTLINNLVSGLIIAFEKPINVGDIVEVAGSIGRMKSIGIRSSVISTWDGSEVIIPNGDLLSQHLVNWTMGNTKRRFEIPVGVAYGTNLEETRKLLQDLMLTDDRILKYPEPFVLVTSFNSSSIDFVLKFWVAHFSIGFDVKSDLMVAIDNLFKEHNIVIPFPQQDVHLKSGGTSARKDEKQNPNEKDKSGFEEDVNKEKSNEIQTNSSQDLQDFRKE
jgi:small-conductance mechanosensitive channel